MTDILQIRGLEVDPARTVETDDKLVIGVQRRPQGVTACPHCGESSPAPNGSRPVRYRDIPVRGKPTIIEWDRQRFLCGSCGRSFADEHPSLRSDRAMTARLYRWLGERSTEHTFESVARDVGMDGKTVRSVFAEWSEDRLQRFDDIKAPAVLGMDEVHLLGKPRGILTNVEERLLIDLLPARTRDVMAKRVARLIEPQRVEAVTMDMWTPYRDIAREMLPRALVVVDKWHVVKYATEALETVRKRFRADLSPKRRRTLLHDRFLLLKRRRDLRPEQEMILSTWTTEFPELGRAYEAKERFFDIYQAGSENEARALYVEWRRTLPENARTAFTPLITAVENWRDPIFAYFRRPVTNAYTEAMNGLVKIANRNGRGYSFDVLRARIMIRYASADRYEEPRLDAETIGFATAVRPFAGVDLVELVNRLEADDAERDSTDKAG